MRVVCSPGSKQKGYDWAIKAAVHGENIAKYVLDLHQYSWHDIESYIYEFCYTKRAKKVSKFL